MSAHPAAMPQDPLVPIFADAWYVTGTVMLKPLVRLIRNMVVLRHEGELTVINAVRPTDEGKAALDALGRVAHVVKIGGHGMDDAWFVETYGAKRWMTEPEGDAAPLIEDGDFPVPGVRVFRFRETTVPESALFVERDGGLAITCDSVQHWAPSTLMSPAARVVTRLLGFQNPAQIGPPWRKLHTPKGGTLKPDFDRLVALPFEKLIGGHGGLCASGAAQALQATIDRTWPAS